METLDTTILPVPISVSDATIRIENKLKSQKLSVVKFLRKTAILTLAITIGNPLSLLFIGIINRIFFRFIDTAFVCYAASEFYRDNYGFKIVNSVSLNYPSLVGVYFQGGKVGLIFGITSVEKDFKNAANLTKFMRNVDLIKNLLGVRAFHYSGILPTELAKHALIPKGYLTERCDIVAKVVIAAEKYVRQLEGITEQLPVILLGGRGNVGRKIRQGLKELGRESHVLDLGDQIPEILRNRRCIVIDVARKGALEEHIANFWNGMIFLNETYPSPKKGTIQKLKNLGIPCYHVTGVAAKAFPKFPGPYANGVPCCALITDKNLQAVVKAL